MGEAFIIDAVRTPLGRRNGALSGLRAEDLAAIPLRALIQRTGIAARHVEDVVYGCVSQVGEQGSNIARNAALVAGFPVDVTGTTVNRLCGSSQQAVNFAAMGVASGHQDLVIAGGVESTSRVPMGSDRLLDGAKVGPSPALSWRFTIVPQGVSAELVAQRYELTRDELDEYALESHRRAAEADDNGRFVPELVGVELGGTLFCHDEGIRRDSTREGLAALRPAFQDDGVLTAASSSQMGDGAAAILLASEWAVREYGLRPRARIVSMATAGVDPTMMLTAPVPATLKALQRASLSMKDLDAIELDESFGSVALGCGRHLEVDFRRVNVFGGAIALGHPLGASGARLLTTLLNVLEQTDGRIGLATMGIGFGQGIATIIDREVYV